MQQVHMRLSWNRKSTGSRCWNEHGSFQTPLVVHWTKPLELNENVTARCVGQTGLGANIVSNVGGWNVCVAPTEQGWKWPMFITFLQVQTILLLDLSLRISTYIYILDDSCMVFTSKKKHNTSTDLQRWPSALQRVKTCSVAFSLQRMEAPLHAVRSKTGELVVSSSSPWKMIQHDSRKCLTSDLIQWGTYLTKICSKFNEETHDFRWILGLSSNTPIFLRDGGQQQAWLVITPGSPW
jgi:hypothetical protein